MVRYKILSLDVWGNADDGWEINDVFRSNVSVEFDIYEKRGKERDEIILAALREAGYLSAGATTDTVNVVDMGEVDFALERVSDGKPLCHLEFIIEA